MIAVVNSKEMGDSEQHIFIANERKHLFSVDGILIQCRKLDLDRPPQADCCIRYHSVYQRAFLRSLQQIFSVSVKMST